jgi:tetratricopeptide (TPR) repeat protein
VTPQRATLGGRAAIGLFLLAGALAGACSKGAGTAPPASGASPAPAAQSPGTRPVTLPDLSRVEATVQEQVKERYAAVQQLLKNPAAPAADKGQAYGSLAMLLHAGEYYEAAEPAYLNAEDLAPMDARWPYLLAHLHKSRGQPDKAQADFERALALQPNDVPTLIWLGRLYLDQGQPEKAAPLFERAQALAPQVVAALVGVGQSALARRDYAKAAAVLEQALKVNPNSSSVHSPLAMAYRGLGDTAKAEAHLKLWRNTEVLVPDPVRQQLDLSLQSGLSFELRGVRALELRDYKAAEGFFRKGIAISPGATMLGRSLRHKLGTALVLMGDVRGAVAQFDEVVRLVPPGEPDETASKAHYSLGVLMASAGRGDEAIAHFSAAVKFNPNYIEALQGLADALFRAGRPQQALPNYTEILRLNPRSNEARFGYAMALVRLNRFREAKDWVVDATRLQPDDPQFRHTLARLLAAAPDAAVRDGSQALTITQELLKSDKTTQIGETLAMALAETGRFSEAIDVQRGVLEAASQAGLSPDVRRMTANLRLYERHQPCRTPWQDNEIVFSPGPPVSPDLAALLPRARRPASGS